MLLAERAGRKLEPCSNARPRGMAVIAPGNRSRNRIRPIGLHRLHSPRRLSKFGRALERTQRRELTFTLQSVSQSLLAVGWITGVVEDSRTGSPGKRRPPFLFLPGQPACFPASNPSSHDQQALPCRFSSAALVHALSARPSSLRSDRNESPPPCIQVHARASCAIPRALAGCRNTCVELKLHFQSLC